MIRKTAWVLGTPARLVLIGLILVYRHTFAAVLGGQCRFHPSCSAYAFDAVRLHGAVKGSVLAVWRVLRCSPMSPGGPDPVPPAGAWHSPVYEGVAQGGPPR